jgi:hypothetical protein
MDSLAIVRSKEDLQRTCEDLANFFSLRPLQTAAGRYSPESLLGIWIDPRIANTLPEVLVLSSDGAGDRRLQIQESVSLSSIWTLCWLAGAGEEGRHRLSRPELLEALTEAAQQSQRGAPEFIPVFPRDRNATEVEAELQLLQRRHSVNVRPPLYLDGATGRFIPPAQTPNQG